MKPLPITSAALVAAGLILAGCTSAIQFSIENLSAPGIWQDRFAAGEVPVISVVARQRQTEATIRITRIPGGSIVWQKAIAPLLRRGNGDDILDYYRMPIPLPDLDVGKYAAELWSKGRLIDQLQFSITGKPAVVSYPKAQPALAAHQPAGFRPIESRVGQLDVLLKLSPEQKDQITKLVAAEAAALAQAPPTESGPIVRKTRADIRALLTPEQQRLYDNAGGSIGLAIGRTRQMESRLIELDSLLVLSPEQKEQITQLLSAEEEASAQTPPGNLRRIQKNETDAHIRALLTPEQQQRFDRFPQPHSQEIAQRRAREAFVAEFLKRCPAVVSRVGEVARVTPRQQPTQILPEQHGSGVYDVEGSTSSEAFIVYWEKPRSAPFKILKLEVVGGEFLPIE